MKYEAKLTSDGKLQALSITSIKQYSPLRSIGLQAGDVITSIGGISLSDSPSLLKKMMQFAAAENGAIEIEFERNGVKQQKKIVVS